MRRNLVQKREDKSHELQVDQIDEEIRYSVVDRSIQKLQAQSRSITVVLLSGNGVK